MIEIKTNEKTKEAFVNVTGQPTEILVELSSVVGAILARPEFTEASIKTFDQFYKKAIKHYKNNERE